jgi:hypothetical protein
MGAERKGEGLNVGFLKLPSNRGMERFIRNSL